MTDDVRIALQGAVGRITLTRPRAINALTHPMIAAVDAALAAWADDDAVECVLIDSEGDRGFCAGGDVKAIRESALGDGVAARALWRDEYRMNARIGAYPTPVVTLLPGIVLGGGVGLGCHASLRVVTSSSRLGMPEVTIGLVPDVGGTHLLARAPGELGTHLALTGTSAGPADAIACGLADVCVSTLDGLGASTTWAALEAAVRAVAVDPGAPELDRGWIDACYAGDDAAVVVEQLLASDVPAAREAGELIGTKSPTAVAVTLAAVRSAATMTLPEALVQEYRISTASLDRPDVAEGIRAQVVEKTRDPRWQPATLAEVDPAEVARHLQPRDDDLRF